MKFIIPVVILLIIAGVGWGLLSSSSTQNGTEVRTDDTYVQMDGAAKTNVRTNDANNRAQNSEIAVAKEKNTMVVLDASGSMNATIAGQKKMDILKDSVPAVFDSIGADTNVGVLVYGQAGSNSDADRAVSCKGIDVLQPLSAVNPATVLPKVDAVFANGWTPIADSLARAHSLLQAAGGSDNEILLISDGEETCGGDPVAMARKLCTAGTRVDVVGFDVTGAVAAELQEIASVCGAYASVNSGSDIDVLFSEGGLSVQTPGANVDFSNGQLQVTTGDADVFIDENGGVQVETNGIEVDTTNGQLDVSVPSDYNYDYDY
jgi:hypothetical protein